MRRTAVLVAAVLVPAVLAMVGACSGGPTTTGHTPTGSAATGGATSPLADCRGLTAPPPRASPPSPPPTVPPPTGGAAAPLPAISLPCFTGGEPVALDELRGPAVVNLWASWCQPCREELPALQRYADRTAGRVHVLGVVTGDRRPAAAALARELGVTFPALADPDERLRAELVVAGLPVTVLLDAAGRVRHVHRGGALDERSLARLVTERLGVAPDG